MLQQTTVAAVIPYFERFLARFPTIASLAEGPEADILKLWEGLGYYSRARNLHKAAQQIMRDNNGQLPSTVDELTALPGIGRYTAGAIASFGFGQPAPIVEANTLRLYSRLIGMTEDPRSTAGQRTLWGFATWLSATPAAPVLNQALMDLGATLCRPQAPQCSECPLKELCTACRDELQDRIPRLPPRTQKTPVTDILFVLQRQDRYLLRQAVEGERWAGLWDFVRFSLSPEESAAARLPLPDYRVALREMRDGPSLFQVAEGLPVPPDLQERVQTLTGVVPNEFIGLAEIKHVVTRFQISLLCFQAEVSGGKVRSGSGYTWFDSAELSELPLSVTGRQVADLLLARTVNPKSRTASRDKR